jgi:hypothetical protein
VAPRAAPRPRRAGPGGRGPTELAEARREEVARPEGGAGGRRRAGGRLRRTAAAPRYTWQWLAELHGVDPKGGAISRKAFRGPDSLFDCLDRDRNGRITADDLDWSADSPFARQTVLVRNWFRKMNAAGDGKLTKKEWQDFFDKAAKGKDALSFEELRDALLKGPAGKGRTGPPKGGGKRSADMQAILLRGLFSGEIGSMNEGPRVGQPAPNFTLRTPDGKESVQLAKLLGKKPVVLVFGSFT